MSEQHLNRDSQKKRAPRPSSPARPKEYSRKKQILLIASILAFVAFLALGIYLISDLPDLTELENVRPVQATRIYSADNKIIHELFTQSRIWVTYDQIPDHVIKATLATEDRDFHNHWGINTSRVIKPIVVNLLTMSYQEGFSTITMQVARNLYQKRIGFRKSITRKLKEIVTALQIERTYSKKEIMEMYLNVSWFGRGAYGIQSAARKYYNKDVSDLTLEEGAYLVGILKGPSNYTPERHYDNAILRRNVVMHNMFICDYLERVKYDSLKQLPLESETWNPKSGTAPYFTEHVRQQLNKLQKTLNVNVYEDGLNVYTTLDTRYQDAIDSAIAVQMPTIQSRVRKSLGKWRERNEVADSVFEEKSLVQIAIVALDHTNGNILGMVGGRDFEKYKFNRATQAKRQPGSTFKPFLYSAAIDNGYTPAYKVWNQPIVLYNPDGTRWSPENFDRSLGGRTTLREGLKKSLNLVAANLIDEIGPRTVVEYAKRMGISSDIRPYYSLAMGSSDVIPLEMVSAFGVLANGGIRVEPISITRIEDRYGNIIHESKSRRTEALNRGTAFIITDMLETAINHGTGGSTRWKYKFHAPAAGKTGTTNDYTDAWFMGFTPHVTAGVWVGLDDQALKLGRQGTGSDTALPFWAEFMKRLYETVEIPQDKFQQPQDVARMDICDDSGEIATNFCPNVIKREVFKVNNHPTESCHLHPGFGRRQFSDQSAF